MTDEGNGLLAKVVHAAENNRFVALYKIAKEEGIVKDPDQFGDLARHCARLFEMGMKLGLVAILAGCMPALREPASDHYVQTQTIADACRGQAGNLNYPEAPCSPDLQSDLDAMALQARCLHAISIGQKCEAE